MVKFTDKHPPHTPVEEIHTHSFEVDLLRMLAGRPQSRITGWGAAVGAAIPWLQNKGLVNRTVSYRDGAIATITWEITPEGIALLDRLEAKS